MGDDPPIKAKRGAKQPATFGASVKENPTTIHPGGEAMAAGV